jgi:beta-lactam-binding protein with PASTA domain
MNSRVLVSFFQIGSLMMLLVAAALLSAITTMHFAIHGAEVQVPALKGMTVADARSETAGLGLNLMVDNRYYSADVAPGHILTQMPPAGTVVRREWRVRVAESLGPQKVEVPDMVGRQERAAALTLRRVGLEVGATARLPYAKTPEGTVLAQDPPGHAQGIARPTVTLLVAAPGDAPDGFVMPDLVGWPVASAQTVLASVGITAAPPSFMDAPVAPVGSGDAPPKPPVKSGAVLAQAPAAGSRVDQSTVVRLMAAQ